MAKFLNLTCSNLDKGDHNKIADALNNSQQILNWNSPQTGQFLIKCTDKTLCSDVRDMANVYENVRLFVTSFNPDNFAYCIRSDWCASTDERLADYSREQRHQQRQKEEDLKSQDIHLTAGFNQKAITLPNGVCIQVNENGEISIQEEGAPPKKVRASNKVMRNIIK